MFQIPPEKPVKPWNGLLSLSYLRLEAARPRAAAHMSLHLNHYVKEHVPARSVATSTPWRGNSQHRRSSATYSRTSQPEAGQSREASASLPGGRHLCARPIPVNPKNALFSDPRIFSVRSAACARQSPLRLAQGSRPPAREAPFPPARTNASQMKPAPSTTADSNSRLEPDLTNLCGNKLDTTARRSNDRSDGFRPIRRAQTARIRDRCRHGNPMHIRVITCSA